MRVLHIGASCGFGGAETATLTLIREQRNSGTDVDAFFTIDRGGAVLFEGLCNVWFPHQYSLTDIILGGHYDVIHIVAACGAGVAPALKHSLYRGAVVMTSHGSWNNFLGCKHVVAVSEFGAKELQPYCQSPIIVVVNGVDISRFRPAERNQEAKPIVGWVGRASDVAKDSSMLLAACASGILDDFEIAIVDGSTSDEGIEQGWLPPRSKMVRQMHWSEMPDFYRSVAESGGFLLSTSRVERCPMNMIEAQACGCPVIAPAVGGIPEVVRDRETGYLYDRSSGPAAVQEAIGWLYAEGRWQWASLAAVANVSANFSAQKMHSKYLAIYQEAVAADRPSSINRIAQGILSCSLTALQPKRHLVRKKS